MGLGHTLWVHGGKFGGVLNGIDYEYWNPEVDWHIPHRYGPGNLDDKYKNKEALRHRLLLRQEFKPIVAYVGRLDHQKGVELIRHALFYALGNGCQFVLLGSSPDRDINAHFRHLKNHLDNNPDCHLEIGYDEDLAHLIYAGSDMMVVPSLFEPCGLTQLIAMKYGTVPIVREVGGLADTVFDADHSHRPYNERNGYVFRDPDYPGLESAMRRAIGMWYSYPRHFRELMLNGMRCDYSWSQPAAHYLNIYDYIRDR
jgi:starch synthase